MASLRVALLLVAALAPGCQLLSGVNELEVDESLLTSEVPRYDWSCLGEGYVQPEDASRVTFHERIVDLTTEKVPEGLVLVACTDIDPACDPPVYGPVVPVDEYLTFEVAGDFEGVLRVTSPSTMPASVDLLRPAGVMRDFTVPHLLSRRAVAAMAALAGVTLRAELGSLLVSTSDCGGHLAAGISLELLTPAPDALQFYTDSDRPDPKGVQTDEDGVGGFVNVPPGLVRVIARVASTGLVIDEFQTVVYADEFTYVPVEPY